jgi:hypothetical protein
MTMWKLQRWNAGIATTGPSNVNGRWVRWA